MSEQSQMSSMPPFAPQAPESVLAIPERFLLDGLLSLTAEGQWMFRGEPIEHRGVCVFLSKQLQRTKEGKYWVVNGPQRALVSVEGTPFFITRLDVDEATHKITAFLNDQSQENLDLSTLFRDEEERLYAKVKRGQAGAEASEAHLALVQRTAVMALEPLLLFDDDGQVAMAWNGETIAIPQHSLSASL